MAVLKIINSIGKYYDNNSREDVINYITNPYKTPGGYIGTYGLNTYEYSKEMDKVALSFNKDTGVRLRHFVIGFEGREAVNAALVYQIGYEISAYLGKEYQTVFSVHQDTEQLHIHIVINAVSYLDGHRYRGTKGEFYGFKSWIDSVLKRYGIYKVRYISNSTL